ncbi:hypothetical protein JCM9140_3789 [Halalkalibacter wakoensis JCM 9140]|uniref:DUF86 domain-containing protein n=1 Tax=Halalkalibacter wakoensis JCM 9140 TaxID=1236970 RepID=W4Q6D2_9BACI|nr:DUF86 domain-containing protein [Halalkalibacter wakoensis]GAE27636.1 hypothetical protein JCM9140_3789 [Halalkalibacter wakoensis JCM 9140]
MYFVDRDKIEQTLVYMESLQEQLTKLKECRDFTEKLAVERIAYVIIESIIDVGNSMIDGFIMRDPGGYEDIIDILEDEKVVTSEDAKALKKLIILRKSLVSDYSKVNHNQLIETFITHSGSLRQFPLEIRRYLSEELGPVSAFLPNGKE